MDTMRLGNDAARTVQTVAAGAARDPRAATPHVSAGDSSSTRPAISGTETRQAPATTAPRQTDRLDLTAVLEHVGEFIDPQRRALAFEIHEELGRAIVSVYDADTDKLIRQIPSEEVVRIAVMLRELAEQGQQQAATGLLLDAKA